jgi:hypothetical protein
LILDRLCYLMNWNCACFFACLCPMYRNCACFFSYLVCFVCTTCENLWCSTGKTCLLILMSQQLVLPLFLNISHCSIFNFPSLFTCKMTPCTEILCSVLKFILYFSVYWSEGYTSDMFGYCNVLFFFSCIIFVACYKFGWELNRSNHFYNLFV